MVKFLVAGFAIAATLVGSQAFAAEGTCKNYAVAVAKNAHKRHYPDVEGGLNVVDVKFLGKMSVSSMSNYEVYFVSGTDEVDGAGFLVSAQLVPNPRNPNKPCKTQAVTLLPY